MIFLRTRTALQNKNPLQKIFKKWCQGESNDRGMANKNNEFAECAMKARSENVVKNVFKVIEQYNP